MQGAPVGLPPEAPSAQAVTPGAAGEERSAHFQAALCRQRGCRQCALAWAARQSSALVSNAPAWLLSLSGGVVWRMNVEDAARRVSHASAALAVLPCTLPRSTTLKSSRPALHVPESAPCACVPHLQAIGEHKPRGRLTLCCSGSHRCPAKSADSGCDGRCAQRAQAGTAAAARPRRRPRRLQPRAPRRPPARPSWTRCWRTCCATRAARPCGASSAPRRAPATSSATRSRCWRAPPQDLFGARLALNPCASELLVRTGGLGQQVVWVDAGEQHGRRPRQRLKAGGASRPLEWQFDLFHGAALGM